MATLVAVALPAAGEPMRRARLVMDVGDLKEHATLNERGEGVSFPEEVERVAGGRSAFDTPLVIAGRVFRSLVTFVGTGGGVRLFDAGVMAPHTAVQGNDSANGLSLLAGERSVIDPAYSTMASGAPTLPEDTSEPLVRARVITHGVAPAQERLLFGEPATFENTHGADGVIGTAPVLRFRRADCSVAFPCADPAREVMAGGSDLSVLRGESGDSCPGEGGRR